MEAADFAGSVIRGEGGSVKCDFNGYDIGHPANVNNVILPHREITTAIVKVGSSNYPIGRKNVKASIKSHGTVLKNGYFIVVCDFHA
jgi:hypothetical protein